MFVRLLLTCLDHGLRCVHTEHSPNTARTQRRVVGACATADVQHQVTRPRVEMIEYPVEKVQRGQSSACVGCCPFSNDQSCFSQVGYNRVSATAKRWWLFDCDPDCAHTERNGGRDVLD